MAAAKQARQPLPVINTRGEESPGSAGQDAG